jgi:hypothetical protein
MCHALDGLSARPLALARIHVSNPGPGSVQAWAAGRVERLDDDGRNNSPKREAFMSANDIAGSTGTLVPPKPPAPVADGREAGGGSPEGAAPQRDVAWGAIVVTAGLIAIVAVFAFAVLEYKTAAEVTTAVGAVSGVIAALVGAYFGIRGATLAQANAESSGSTAKRNV